MSSSSTQKRKFKKQAKSDLLASEALIFNVPAQNALNMKGGIFGNGKSQKKTQKTIHRKGKTKLNVTKLNVNYQVYCPMIRQSIKHLAQKTVLQR